MKNFWIRFASSAVLVIMVIIAVGVGGYFLAAALLLASLTAYHELLSLKKGEKSDVSLADDHPCGKDSHITILGVSGLLTILAYYLVLVWGNDWRYLFFVAILSLAFFMAGYAFSFPRLSRNEVMEAFVYVLYAPVMMSFVYLAREMEHGVYVVALIFICSWVCDTCAYLVGLPFGRHRLAPELSPKKSIEGAIGGVGGAMLVGGVLGFVFARQQDLGWEIIFTFVLISAVGAVIAQIGDLAASAIKRSYGVKDFGRIIPGHGGILDRFDSVLFAAPMIYVLVILFVKL
ncbi:MAG: phosphatidate cytidylyltransferase [Lachnospiraceae bacterium]|jgi:phosphatidate cytidylyltransferase|nr:phosphatidate cytidylyltransferase [Lachnospiraceae bacterium]